MLKVRHAPKGQKARYWRELKQWMVAQLKEAASA
jgi:hypothetical protein